jgi:hypothetical protein
LIAGAVKEFVDLKIASVKSGKAVCKCPKMSDIKSALEICAKFSVGVQNSAKLRFDSM